ncbi:MAG TPA: DUF362 domain-containing protein [Phycisphaerae bacterium]|nr:DUF362 domain-containing protein [Phycisphaerae bacterium]HRY67283.1 DUF362 domain-containing protein [Phycisphaerae bacterium]HSA26347.1 DUF362 domain-containing protein [Phycisphaerae bacterium]
MRTGLELFRVHRQIPTEHLTNVSSAVRAELIRCGVRLKPGDRIAVAVGSRGITHLVDMVREVVTWVRSQGATPFLVPAMGSHGGATAAGQQAILEYYGLSQEATGAEIRSSMEVVELPRGDLSTPVYLDAQAAAADGTILINRVKPHTSFHGRYESGIMKMLAIGLGKRPQALVIHQLGAQGLRDTMPRIARQILKHGNILLGLAVVENACNETMRIKAIPARDIEEEEPPLLEIARANAPALPVTNLDILIVDEIGKNISGLGMDTNVIGRLGIRGQPEPQTPTIRIIIVRDLAAASCGNAVGIGLADITTRRLFNKLDFRATYENALTSTCLERAKVPMVADTDRQALDFALQAIALQDTNTARIIRIHNTLRIDRFLASPAVLEELSNQPGIEVLGQVEPLFDEQENMTADLTP